MAGAVGAMERESIKLPRKAGEIQSSLVHSCTSTGLAPTPTRGQVDQFHLVLTRSTNVCWPFEGTHSVFITRALPIEASRVIEVSSPFCALQPKLVNTSTSLESRTLIRSSSPIQSPLGSRSMRRIHADAQAARVTSYDPGLGARISDPSQAGMPKTSPSEVRIPDFTPEEAMT